LFNNCLDCSMRRDIFGAFDGLHDRRGSGDNLLCFFHLLGAEANFIKLAAFWVANNKDIPSMDQITQCFRDERRQARWVGLSIAC
jgi:hypothetical protein